MAVRGLLGSIHVRGELHARLHRALKAAVDARLCTQDSLGQAIAKSQESVGQYLRNAKAGPLDLDEAEAGLQHIGSSLRSFLAGDPPRTLTATDRLARELETRPQLRALVEALIPVPKPRLDEVLSAIRVLAPLAIARRATAASGPRSGPAPETHTRPAPARRRSDKARRTRKGKKGQPE